MADSSQSGRPKPGRLRVQWPPQPNSTTEQVSPPYQPPPRPSPRNEKLATPSKAPVQEPAVAYQAPAPIQKLTAQVEKLEPPSTAPVQEPAVSHEAPAPIQKSPTRVQEPPSRLPVQEPTVTHEEPVPTQKPVHDTPAASNVAHHKAGLTFVEKIDPSPHPPVEGTTHDAWMPKKRKTIEKLGEGAFGIVWKCCDTESLRLFVAKETIIKDDENMTMAENEVERLKQLQHEHVTQYYGSVKEKHTIVIFMEYYSAGSLKHMINNVGPLEENTAIMYIRQILNGLAYIHSKLILHCDLKCENLLLDGHGKIKIGDFGVAVQMVLNNANQSMFMQGSTVTGGGTLYWMAPEVIKQERYGRKADVWSLGCTIVEMMTSLPPYRQEYPNETRFMGALSGNRLSYKAEEILPSASDTMKNFLSTLFIVDYQERGYGGDAEKKFNEDFPR